MAACRECHDLKDRFRLDTGWTTTQFVEVIPPESAHRARLLFITLGALAFHKLGRIDEFTEGGPGWDTATEFVTGEAVKDESERVPLVNKGWRASEVYDAVKECPPGMARVLLAKMVMVGQAYEETSSFPLEPDLKGRFLR